MNASEEIRSDSLERREVYYSGHVQGVGFRYTTRGLAASQPIGGYVRNLPDGRVQLVAEGVGAELEGFLQRIDRELGRHIRAREVLERPATGEFATFEIAF